MDVDKNPTVLATKKRKAADISPPFLQMEDVFDEVDLYDAGKLPHGYVEVIAGASEDDIEDVAEPIVALEYTRWKNRQRKQGKQKQAGIYFRLYIVCDREKIGRGGVKGVAKVLEE